MFCRLVTRRSISAHAAQVRLPGVFHIFRFTGDAIVSALSIIEQGLEFSQQRAALLASDAANVGTPGFVARDIAPAPRLTPQGMRFAAALDEAPSQSGIGMLEYAMGAIAKNGVWFRALSQQARAILREFKTVAEESRR